MSYRAISEELGISEAEVKRIEDSALEKIADMLEGADEFERILFGIHLAEQLSTPENHQYGLYNEDADSLVRRILH